MSGINYIDGQERPLGEGTMKPRPQNEMMPGLLIARRAFW